MELNLRLPTMLHGKKVFERVVWAFDNVLNHSLAWLFCDLGPTSSQGEGLTYHPFFFSKNEKLTLKAGIRPGPIQNLHPQVIDCVPLRNNLGPVTMPPLAGLVSNEMSEAELQESCGALAEWIAMVQLRSPRVSAGDDIDPYLSRYTVPGDGTHSSALVSLKWHGLVSAKWTMQLFVNML